MSVLLEELVVTFPKVGDTEIQDSTIPPNLAWTNRSFMTGKKDIPDVIGSWLYWGSADLKATNSAFGGNFSINCRPQWTPAADARRRGTGANTRSYAHRSNFQSVLNTGMGRMYSEQQDDNVQRIYLRFGVPQFNSLSSFLSTMTDSDMVSLANTGSAKGILYNVSRLIGGFYVGIKQPVLVGLIVLIKGVSWVAQEFLWNGGAAFYSLKPTQHLYWGSVQAMMNEYLVRAGIIGFNMPEYNDSAKTVSSRYAGRWALSQDDMSKLHAMMPDIFSKHMGLDVTALAGRAIRRQRQKYQVNLENDSDNRAVEFQEFLKSEARNFHEGGATNSFVKVPSDNIDVTVKETSPLSKLWTAAQSSGYYSINPILNPTVITDAAGGLIAKVGGEVADATIDVADVVADAASGLVTGITDIYTQDSSTLSRDFRQVTDPIKPDEADANAPVVPEVSKAEKDALKKGIFDYLELEMDVGMEFVAFDVNYTGTVEESFSNSVKASELGEMLGGIASGARSAKFTLAGGNILGGPIGQVAGFAISSVADIATGLIDGATMGLASSIVDILRGAQIDIPKYWESSDATLPSASYTIPLRASAGNVISQIKGIYLPMFCLLAGGLPQMTGGSSHTNPLYCQLFDVGRMQKNLAMITGINITRGVGSTGFDQYGRALAIDLTFDITDLSPILAAPSGSDRIEPNEPLGHYIAGLAAQTMESQIYGKPRFIMNVNRFFRDFESSSILGSQSSASGANWVAQTFKSSPIYAYSYPYWSWASTGTIQQ